MITSTFSGEFASRFRQTVLPPRSYYREAFSIAAHDSIDVGFPNSVTPSCIRRHLLVILLQPIQMIDRSRLSRAGLLPASDRWGIPYRPRIDEIAVCLSGATCPWNHVPLHCENRLLIIDSLIVIFRRNRTPFDHSPEHCNLDGDLLRNNVWPLISMWPYFSSVDNERSADVVWSANCAAADTNGRRVLHSDIELILAAVEGQSTTGLNETTPPFSPTSI